MDLTIISAFLATAILLTLLPGPDILFVLSESITQGRKRGYFIAVGLVSGVFVHTLAAATGLSLMIQQSALLFDAIKVVGGIYLFYLAFMASRERSDSHLQQAAEEQPSTQRTEVNKVKSVGAWASVRTGFLMNVLNPKVALFFIALLPQFLTLGGWNNTLQLVVLGGLFAVQALVIFCIVAYLAGSLSSYLRKPSVWIWAKWIKVVLYVVLGSALFVAN